jgi:hypothetical protein
MGEHEKYEQVGRLAEEVSHVKGKLGHVNEKGKRAQGDYGYAANMLVFPQLRTHGGKLIVPQINPGTPVKTLEGLLNFHELTSVIEEKERLTVELGGLTAPLKELAPHLL